MCIEANGQSSVAKSNSAYCQRKPGADSAFSQKKCNPCYSSWKRNTGMDNKRTSEAPQGDTQAGQITVERRGIRSWSARLIIGLIRVYQHFISPFLPGRCRFYPSCSEYAVQCFKLLPMHRAAPRAAWRILRCNPFTTGYFDPVLPEQRTEES